MGSQKPRHQHFRTYLVTLVLLVCGALIVSSAIGLFFSYQDTRNTLAGFQREKARSAAITIHQFVEELERQARRPAQTPREASSRGLELRLKDYQELLKHVPAITELSYLDRDGKERIRVSRISSNIIGSGEDFSAAKKFREARSEDVYFSPVYFRDDSEPYMTIGVPERGSDAGVVTAETNLKFILESVSRISVGRAGDAYLVDENGVLIAHPDIALVLRKTNFSHLSQVQAALAAPLNSANPRPTVTFARDHQDQWVLTTYQPIDPPGWYVFVEQPLSEAFAPLYSVVLRSALFLVFGLAMAILASFFLARRVVAPIQVMQVSAEQIEQELEVARVIQQTLLPKEVPHLSGWQISALYQPAREVGGDFYDFLELPGGRWGFVIGDATDKGVPASLVMATARAMLRAAAESLVSPSMVLERVNELLYLDIPPQMFVTCLYAVLDPATGRIQFANAGHDVPYWRTADGVKELRATGMPLGLMPGMTYEEQEITVLRDESILFYSDGLVEAHNRQRDMFGLPLLQALMSRHPGGSALIEFLLDALAEFTGAGWEQEDDLTFVTLKRTEESVDNLGSESMPPSNENAWRDLAEFSLASQPGNEMQAIQLTESAVKDLALPQGNLERLKTAVAEATMNAMEHGNGYRPDLSVSVKIAASKTALAVKITDHGGGQPIPDPEMPDLGAKLEGRQSPRGWGLFLIKNMVDEMTITSGEDHHTIELVLYFERGQHDVEVI